MDKTHTQAQITRQRNKEARAAARAERDAQERQDKALVLEALRAVLKDPEATTEQRLYAVAVLDNMQHYSFTPYGVKYQGSADATADFVKELEAYQESKGK